MGVLRKVVYEMCFQSEFQRRYKLSGAGMVTDMTLLQNAEFKEAFDEFDKVRTSQQKYD